MPLGLLSIQVLDGVRVSRGVEGSSTEAVDVDVRRRLAAVGLGSLA